MSDMAKYRITQQGKMFIIQRRMLGIWMDCDEGYPSVEHAKSAIDSWNRKREIISEYPTER